MLTSKSITSTSELVNPLTVNPWTGFIPSVDPLDIYLEEKTQIGCFMPVFYQRKHATIGVLLRILWNFFYFSN